MFRANKSFLEHLNCKDIENINPNVKCIKINGISDFSKKTESNKRNIEVTFYEDIIMTTSGKMSNQISVLEEDFYKWFDCEVITFCSAANNSKEFDDEKCEEGDLVFYAPLSWLIETINSDTCYFPMGYNSKKITNLSDFLDWTNICTHYEGQHILTKAINENILTDKPTIRFCNYCNLNNNFK